VSTAAVDWRRLAQVWGIALLWVVAGYYAVLGLPYYLGEMRAVDSHAYWLTGHTDGDLYGRPATTIDAYLYSPAFAQLVRPLTLLPFPVFAVLWSLAALAVLLWLLWPGRLRWTVPLFAVACVPEVILGNIYAFLALALVLALSPRTAKAGPLAYTFPVLTKVTTGVCLLWPLVRRDLRALVLAAAGTAVVAGLSFLVSPSDWRDWIAFLTRGDSHPTAWFPVRAAVAVALAVVAARLGRPALVPVAVLLALPVVAGPSVLTLLAAVPRLRRDHVAERPADTVAAHSTPREKAASRSWRE
jgi:hypothetical protein